MKLSKELAMLKLAAKFANKKDYAARLHVVNFVKCDDNRSELQATNGHVAIKINFEGDFLPENNILQYEVCAIETACKVNNVSLLEAGYAGRFPTFEKVFTDNTAQNPNRATFDIKYMALIFKALEAFCKDTKCKFKAVTFEPLRSNNANFLLCKIEDLTIEIAIMPIINKVKK